MSDIRPVDAHPSVPSVAIVGNDALLAAAPATSVQLAHACLHRGFSVAVPASWGDELLAAETLRRLTARARGPAVMCVCPYARTRLLAPGPDLASFLVSLVSPPVAVARYLRAVYGEGGVHLTYIGSCPGADDPVIDRCITPDTFLAEIAEHGIALSEQPLVFDSIVPPDRRRWSSVPGGVPTAETLWSDCDGRALITIEHDDVSADLAQHIIAREHALIDPAPALGCACSGAVGGIPAGGARGAVTALEPPRALGPVVDPAIIVDLELETPSSVTPGGMPGPPTWEPTSTPSPVDEPGLRALASDEEAPGPVVVPASVAPASELESDLAPKTSEGERAVETQAAEILAEPQPLSPADPVAERPVARADIDEPDSTVPATAPSDDGTDTARVDAHDAGTIRGVHDESRVGEESTSAEPPAGSAELIGAAGALPSPSEPSAGALAHEPPRTEEALTRRRTPAAFPARPAMASVPKARATAGRSLPRAYVAKRRTPSSGAAPLAETPRAPDTPRARQDHDRGSDDASAAETTRPSGSPIVAEATTPSSPHAGNGTESQSDSAATATPDARPGVSPAREPLDQLGAESSAPPPGAEADAAPASDAGASRARAPRTSPVESATNVTARQGLIAVLIVALVALGVLVVWSLRS